MVQASQSFAPLPSSARAARRFATSVLESWQLDAVADEVRVVVSELATNAALHARTDFTVSLATDGQDLRLSVTDMSPARPRVRRRAEIDRTTGRGLLMVEQMSSDWGVLPESEGGKTVWCTFPLRGPGEPAAAHGLAGLGGLEGLDEEALLTRFGDTMTHSMGRSGHLARRHVVRLAGAR